MWILLATLVGWGSYVFAKRDPRSTSWTKIAFAAVPLTIFGLIANLLVPYAQRNFSAQGHST